MNYQTLSRISTATLVIAVVLFIASLAYLITTRSYYSPERPSEPIVRNMVMSDSQIRNGNVRYYNGNTFVELATDDHTLTPLTPSLRFMTDIWSAHWLEGGVVVSFGSLPLDPSVSQHLSTEMSRIGESNRLVDPLAISNFYWYVNFSDNTISYLTYTDNPFDISISSDGQYVFFTDTPSDTDMSLVMSGQVSSEKGIARGIYGVVESGPHRVIHRDKTTLYVLRQETEDDIALVAYSLDDYSEKVVVDRVYQTPNHTIYEEATIHNGSLYVHERSTDDTERTIDKISLETGNRSTQLTYSASPDVRVTHVENSIFQIANAGANRLEVKHTNVDTDDERFSVVLPARYYEGTYLYDGEDIFIATRPDLRVMTTDTSSVEAAYSGPLEDDYSSEHSALIRDIFNPQGDLSSYSFVVSSGNLADEYRKLERYVSEKGMSIHEFTFLPEIGRNAEIGSF